jgi:hypothetical protein
MTATRIIEPRTTGPLSAAERRWLLEVSDGAWQASDKDHHALVEQALAGDESAAYDLRCIPREEGGLRDNEDIF